jgi:hypothetical protein
LEPKPGLNRFIWDLTHDGATVIPGAAVDSGGAGARIPVAPGTYSVVLKVGPLTLIEKVDVRGDHRWYRSKSEGAAALVVKKALQQETSPADASTRLKIPNDLETTKLAEMIGASVIATRELESQQQLSIRVRDDISKLADTVARLRAVKKQVALRKELLKDRDEAKDLLKQSEALDKSLNEVEEKLHNPKAKISYDIFAARGGAMLYSQYAWLLSNLVDADGAPTKAQLELADDLGRQLAELVTKFEGVAKDNVGKLNDSARKLGVPELYVPPPAKKKEEAKQAEKK